MGGDQSYQDYQDPQGGMPGQPGQQPGFGAEYQSAVAGLRGKFAEQLQQVKEIVGPSASDEEILQMLEMFGGDVMTVINNLFG